jgi:DNA polymerase
MAKQERSAGCVVFRNTDSGREYLLLDTGRFWDFPKGHGNRDETDLQTALRELAEETGIIDAKIIPGFVHEIHYFFRDKRSLVRKTVIYFLASTAADSVKISSEHVGYEFLSYEKAMARLAYANARAILKLAEAKLA